MVQEEIFDTLCLFFYPPRMGCLYILFLLVSLLQDAETSREVPEKQMINTDDVLSEEDWEEEANNLYEWTQELSFDDIGLTPRLPTAQMVG